MEEQKLVKVVLLTGYLGSGKTTIVNHILSNTEGIRAAVIVNDIGEVNIDASLISDNGVTSSDDVIPLTNGCLCCSLSDNLTVQLGDIADTFQYDYIIIEASGICEPIPITYNIQAFSNQSSHAPGHAHVVLDNIVAVVDCARMYDEFKGGKALFKDDLNDDDIENLLVQQIEFCTTLVLNKTDLVTEAQIKELKALVRSLQKDAAILEAVNGKIPMTELVDTNRFDLDKAYRSAAWMDAMDHPEEHEDPEVLEYGIKTFVYTRRQPFDGNAFSAFVNSWGSDIIRVKGKIWTMQDPDMSYVFEQAGKQVTMYENGMFFHAFAADHKEQIFKERPELAKVWDPEFGDRITQLCFIGHHIDKDEITKHLDECLVTWPKQ